MSVKVKVDLTKLYVMLLCSVRYAIGRQSYVVEIVRDLIKEYEKHLSQDEQNQIYLEVSRELERCNKLGTTLGAQMDHDMWQKLVDERKI
jgi:hypothetical protein